MSEITLTKNNFEAEVIKADIPVLVDFWASWCGPCKMLSPIISEIADEYDGKIKVCKVNVDDEAELSQRYNIVSIPTVIAFKRGEPVNKSVGYCPKEDLIELFNV